MNKKHVIIALLIGTAAGFGLAKVIEMTGKKGEKKSGADGDWSDFSTGRTGGCIGKDGAWHPSYSLPCNNAK